MQRSRPRWWRLVLAAVPALAAATILATSWSGLRGSHPAYPATLVAVVVVGTVVASRALGHREDRARSTPGHRVRTALGRGAALVLVAALTAALVWLRPFPADDVALTAAGTGYEVDRTTTFTRIDLAPVGRRVTTGLVFYPGARVDPRAYVPLLSRVAARGYRVVIVKPAFDLAFADPGGARRVVERDAEVEHWAVGGHSLGGVVAARAAAGGVPGVDGLVLWASYPARDLSGSRLSVTSVYGTRDGLTTTADVEASRTDLPEDADLVPVEGAVHAFFGDYGDQPGDGRATTDRAVAQEEIVTATVDALARLRQAR